MNLQNKEQAENQCPEFPHVFSFGQINKNTIESLLTKFKEEFQITLTETEKQIYGS
ncbi:hypothetical protein [Elizabethkingia ursingii]